MAKKTTRSSRIVGGTEVGSGRSVEDAALNFAEDLGRFLGTTQKKAEEWLGQRRNIVDRLTQIRDAANGYLQQLSGEDAEAKRNPGRPAGSVARARGIDFGGAVTRNRPEPLAGAEDGFVVDGGKRKRRGMSVAQRKAVGVRMKKYWAERRKQSAKK